MFTVLNDISRRDNENAFKGWFPPCFWRAGSPGLRDECQGSGGGVGVGIDLISFHHRKWSVWVI